MRKLVLSVSIVVVAIVAALVFSGVAPVIDRAEACNPKIERC